MALDTKKSTSLRDGYGQTYRDGGFVEVNDKMNDLVDSGVFKLTSTVTVTSGSRNVRSGAMTIPGGSIITDLGAVVTTATTQASSTQGIQFGTGSDGYDITGKGDVQNFNSVAATALTVGRGTTMYTQSSKPLGAMIEVPVNAHDTGLFFASDTDIHGTMSSSVSFGTGAFTFVVKYTNIV